MPVYNSTTINYLDNNKKSWLKSITDITLGSTVLIINNLNRFTELPIIPTTTTTTVNPFERKLLSYNDIEISKDINTYISNNIYGISLIFTGITEILRGRFNHYKSITNVINGACLTASGINMFCANEINKVDCIVPSVAGIKHITDTLCNYQPFNEELTPLINSNVRNGEIFYESINHNL